MDDFIRVVTIKLNEETRLLNKFKKRKKQLERYEGESLQCVKIKGRNKLSYYIHHRGDPASIRHYCNNKQSSVVANIQEYHYLKKAIAQAELNISVLNAVLKGYKSTHPDSIVEELARAYKNQEQAKRTIFNQINSDKWVKQKLAEKAEYLEHNPDRHPDHLRHRTSDGNYTRSKSELTIYELLISLGCTFIYEVPIFLVTQWYVCDFMVLLPNGSTLIIEHMGLAGDPGYLGSKLNVLEEFIRIGYIPNVNLILTFEDVNGNIDMQAITKLITTYVQ